MDIIIVSPNLDPSVVLGGVAAVSRFIVENNKVCNYIHFELGRRHTESGGFERAYHLWKTFKSWRQILKSHPNAIVHYNFPLSPEAIIRDSFFMREARKQKRKMIVHIHGGLYMNASHIPFALHIILKKLFHWNVPFLVLSEREKEVLLSRFSPKTVYVLPNCVEIGGFVGRSDKSSVLTIGYLGRITEAKGMKELLDACIVLQSKGIPYILKIAGSQDKNELYLEGFEKSLGNSFEYMGIISGKTKKDFLNSIDVFVLPSYYEGLPLSLLESMSYGAVPVVTPVGSVTEVVKDGVNGLLIEDHDVDSIVNAIIRLYEQEKLRNDLSEAARATIVEQFNPSRYFEELNTIYQSV